MPSMPTALLLLVVLPPIVDDETDREWRWCKGSGEDEARDGGLG